MRIGILTGGGDVPGLNPCIKALVNRMIDEGHTPLGILRGWGGLLRVNPADPATLAENTLPLDRLAVRTIDRTGGTMLRTSRTNPAKMPADQAPAFLKTPTPPGAPLYNDYTQHILGVLAFLQIDVLVAIGGDDTLSYGARLHKEGFPVICIPKTMDNDVTGTDYCIGFSTAITRTVSAIHKLRTTAGSHERIAIVELFGRYSGETSLISAYLAGVDRCIISEVPFETGRLADLLMTDKHANPRNYCMMTISEGAREVEGEIVQSERIIADPYGHKKLGGIGALTAAKIERLTRQSTLFMQYTFLMRSGPPDTLDTMVAVNFAHCAMDLIAQKQYGRMVAVQGGRYTHVPADVPLAGPRRVNVEALYDPLEYRPRVRPALNLPMFLY